MKRTLLAISLCCFSAVAARAATDVWSSHITNAGGWKTTVQVFNGCSFQMSFSVFRFDDTGAAFGKTLTYDVPSMQWLSVPETDLNYSGSLRLTSVQNQLVKVRYQFGSSPSICEFYLAEQMENEWVIPNPSTDWMAYTGLALVNPTGGTVYATVQAWKVGAKVGEKNVSLATRNRYVKLSSEIWPSLAIADFDTIIVKTTEKIPAPMSISGNGDGDRHLFFTARKQPQEYMFVDEFDEFSGWEYTAGSNTGALFQTDFGLLSVANYGTKGAEWYGPRAVKEIFRPIDVSSENFTLDAYINSLDYGNNKSGEIKVYLADQDDIPIIGFAWGPRWTNGTECYLYTYASGTLSQGSTRHDDISGKVTLKKASGQLSIHYNDGPAEKTVTFTTTNTATKLMVGFSNWGALAARDMKMDWIRLY